MPLQTVVVSPSLVVLTRPFAFTGLANGGTFNSVEHFNLANGHSFYINGVEVLSSTQVLGLSVGGSGGGIVTEDAVQTLTDKTLSGATLTGTLTAGGGTGTSGQALFSTGSGVQWQTSRLMQLRLLTVAPMFRQQAVLTSLSIPLVHSVQPLILLTT